MSSSKHTLVWQHERVVPVEKMAPLSARLVLKIGPMYAKKTTELRAICESYAKGERKVIIVKFAEDNRYTEADEIVTHDDIRANAIPASRLADIMPELLQHDVIGIDEGSFFPDLVEAVHQLLEENKVIVVAILDGAYNGDVFSLPSILMLNQYKELRAKEDDDNPTLSLRWLQENLDKLLACSWTNLIPYADELHKLYGVCSFCGEQKAGMTLKVGSNTQVVEIGSVGKYVTACYKCWKKRGGGIGLYNPLATSQ